MNHYSSYLCCSENERAGHERPLRAGARPGLLSTQCGLLAATLGRGMEQFKPKPCPTLPSPGCGPGLSALLSILSEDNLSS